MTQYTDALAGIMMIELQQTVPAKKVPEEHNQPTRNHDRSDEATTTRDLVASYTRDFGVDYRGRARQDVYITAALLAEVVGFSKETARRRLKFFEENGIVTKVYDQGEYRDHYRLKKEFSGVDDETVRSRQTIADTGKKLFDLLEME